MKSTVSMRLLLNTLGRHLFSSFLIISITKLFRRHINLKGLVLLDHIIGESGVSLTPLGAGGGLYDILRKGIFFSETCMGG